MSSCDSIREQFSPYLDGRLTGVAMQAVAAHLERCGDCAADFGQWRTMQHALAGLGPVRAPADLGLRIRVALSKEHARTTKNALASWKVRWENTIAPFLWQAGAGLASSLVLVGTMAFLIGAFAAPEPAAARDEPLGMATAPRFVSWGLDGNAGTLSAPVTVEVYVDAKGRVYDYDIVSGPSDAATRAALEAQLISVDYKPAEWYGQPVRGVAVLTFSGVSVQG